MGWTGGAGEITTEGWSLFAILSSGRSALSGIAWMYRETNAKAVT